MGLFILGVIVGIVLMALAIKKGYILLKVKRKKPKLPDDLECGRCYGYDESWHEFKKRAKMTVSKKKRKR